MLSVSHDIFPRMGSTSVFWLSQSSIRELVEETTKCAVLLTLVDIKSVRWWGLWNYIGQRVRYRSEQYYNNQLGVLVSARWKQWYLFFLVLLST